MKYIAVLDTDDYEDFGFFEDGKEKYLHGIDANSVNGEWIYLPFKPLEQDPVLDKVRAEIKDWQTDIHDNEYDADKYDFVFERIFEIIDEYKAENEG